MLASIDEKKQSTKSKSLIHGYYSWSIDSLIRLVMMLLENAQPDVNKEYQDVDSDEF